MDSVEVRNLGLGGRSFLQRGNFNVYHTSPRSGVVRVTSTGVLDKDFDPGTGIDQGSTVYTIAILPDDKVLIGGNFNSYNEAPRYGVARINSDGTLDTVCDSGSGPNNSISSLAVQQDGKILVAGKFTTYNGDSSRAALVRLNGDPRLGRPTKLENGQTQITFLGQDQLRYNLQASSNLVDWVSIITNFTATGSPMPLVDPDVNLPKRFYRAVSAP